MGQTGLDVFDTTLDKTNAWLNEVAAELGVEERQEAYRAFRAYLHVLRDRLPVGEAAHLAAQLPMLIRGVYYEGWTAGSPEDYDHPQEFLERMAAAGELAGPTEASLAADAAARVLARHLTTGQLRQVAGVLPAELRGLVDPDALLGETS